MDTDVVRQYASLEYAAKCYSVKRKVEPSVESRMLYGGGSAFDIVAAYLRGRVNPTVVEKAVESHFLHLLSIGRTRSCLDALEAVVYDPAKQNEEEAVTFYIDLAVMSTDEQREIFLVWFRKFIRGRTDDSIASLKELLGVDVEGTLSSGEDAKRGLLHFGPTCTCSWVRQRKSGKHHWGLGSR